MTLQSKHNNSWQQ